MTLHALPALETARESLDRLSDIALVGRVRGADLDAFSTLTARHIDAVETLAVAMAGEVRRTSLVADTFARARHAIEGAEGPGLSVRTWLLRLTLFEYAARTVPTSHHPHVAAFDALPAAWQVALWHLAVEGEAAESVALSLGTTPTEVLATARRAIAEIRRSVLRDHRPADPTSPCAELNERLDRERDEPLTTGELRRAAKHADVCAACAALLDDLGSVATGLRDTLAHGVLGAAAGAVYLATRPAPLYDLSPPTASALSGLRRASTGSLRLVVAGVVAAGVAAAASAVLLGQPATSPREVYGAEGELGERRSDGPSGQRVVGRESPLRLTSVESTPSDGLPLDQPANPDRAPIESTPAPTHASGAHHGKGSGTGSDGQNGGLPGTDPLPEEDPVADGPGSGPGSDGSDEPDESGGGQAPAPVRVEVSGSGVKVETPAGEAEAPLPEAPVVTEVVDDVGGVVDEGLL